MRRLLIALALSLAAAAPAVAAQTVQLRADVPMHNGRVTLGDLFEGAGPASGVIVAVSGSPVLALDALRVQVVAQANGLSWDNAAGVRRIIASADAPQGGARPAPGQAAAPAARMVSVLAYGRDIAAGEIVQPEDLVWSKSLAAAPIDAPRDSDAVIGQAARRPLRAGTAVAQHDVSPPQVIKRDDMISVAFESDGLKLVLQAKALSGAAVGDVFMALNPGSKKEIQVVATGPGEAAVGPEADRLRANLRANPQFLASLR